MSYYNRYKNKKRGGYSQGAGRGGHGGSGHGGMNDPNDPNSLGLLGSQPQDAIFDLGKNKRVTVRQFRNINLIDIREYYQDSASGEMRPGKKGISLTEDLYDELLKHRLNIDDALRRFGSRRPRTKTVRLVSDDEDEDEEDENNQDKESGAKGGSEKTKSKKRVRDVKEGEAIEPKSRKQKVAPPTLLLHEETIANAEREANATLVIPSIAKAQVPETTASAPAPAPAAEQPTVKADPEPTPKLADPAPAAAAAPQASTAAGAASSDGESLEAEMNKIFDDISEEE